jgi:hypothetical protein
MNFTANQSLATRQTLTFILYPLTFLFIFVRRNPRMAEVRKSWGRKDIE